MHPQDSPADRCGDQRHQQQSDNEHPRARYDFAGGLSGTRQTALEKPVHVTDRLPLGVVDDVGIDVHRDADLTVAEDLHDDPRRDAGRRQQRGAAVPRVVQSDHPQTGVSSNASEGL